MYPNILLSVLILILALQVIGGMLGNQKLIKAAGVGAVLLIAAALILWLLLGLNPIPGWFIKLFSKAVHKVESTKF